MHCCWSSRTSISPNVLQQKWQIYVFVQWFSKCCKTSNTERKSAMNKWLVQKQQQLDKIQLKPSLGMPLPFFFVQFKKLFSMTPKLWTHHLESLVHGSTIGNIYASSGSNPFSSPEANEFPWFLWSSLADLDFDLWTSDLRNVISVTQTWWWVTAFSLIKYLHSFRKWKMDSQTDTSITRLINAFSA